MAWRGNRIIWQDGHDAPGDALPRFATEGLLAGTEVATPGGFLPVAALSPGDEVLCFDGPAAVVVEMHRGTTTSDPERWPAAHWPLRVPAQVLGNRAPLDLLPGQGVLLESDLADEMFGDPFALVPVAALQGWRGIAPVRPDPMASVVVLVLEQDQIIYADGAALVLCPGADGWRFGASELRGTAHAPLSLATARQFAACLIAEDAGAALSRATPAGSYAAFD